MKPKSVLDLLYGVKILPSLFKCLYNYKFNEPQSENI